ncbi:MAG: DUF349 domain-containing protein, partial [Gammaproteobacteria bacterium]
QEIGRSARGHDKTVARLAAGRLSDLRERRERSVERERLLDELSRLVDTDELDADVLQRTCARWKRLEEDADTTQRQRYAGLEPRLDARLAALRRAQQEDLSNRLEREKLLEQLRRLGKDLHGADPNEARAALRILSASWGQATPLQDRWTGRRLQEDWQELSVQIEAALREREKFVSREKAIATATEEFESALERGGLKGGQVEAARQRYAELAGSLGDEPVHEKSLERLRGLMDRLAAELAREQQALKARRQKLRDVVQKLEKALEQKQLEPAAAAHKTATKLLAQEGAPGDLEALQRRLTLCEPRLRELQSWRNWSSDKAREELVEEARRLVEADVPVEERAQTLNQLRARWKALGAGGPRTRPLWESFDAACTAAYQPVKQDRKQQAQRREQNLKVREEICSSLERLAADTDWFAPDWRAVSRALTEAKRRWRDTGGVPHKKWTAVKERFGKAVEGIEQHLAKERRHNFLQRQALAKQARELADSAELDTRQAVAEARRLREAWQVTAHSSRKDEQALWKAFNGALDEVFNRDRTARNEFRAGLEEQRRQAEALCAELEELSRIEGAEAPAMRAELARLTTAFGQLGALPKQARQGLETRFRQAREKLQRRIVDINSANARQALADYQILNGICERIEALAQNPGGDSVSSESLRAQWQAASKPATHKELLAALERRFAQAMETIEGTGQAPDAQMLSRNAARRSEICLDLEILRKRESPPDFRNERMQRQVALLEAAMKGTAEPEESRVRRLQLDYLRLGPVPDDQRQALSERFSRLLM